MNNDGTAFLISIGVFGSIIGVGFLIHRLLKRKIDWFSLLALAFCLSFAVVTKQQINKKSKILGYYGERSIAGKKITRKKQEIYRGKDKSEMRYYLCYQDNREVCLDVNFDEWLFKKEGDSMPVISIKGDNDVYHPSGIYTNEGNMAFDKILLIFELLGALVFTLKIIFPRFLSFERFNKADNISLFKD
jgi:hypothetical protein